MKKRMLLCMLLVAFIFLGFSIENAKADESYTYKGNGYTLTYTLGGKKATIIDCSNDATKVVIPSKINGYTVTFIGEKAFYKCDSLKNVIIPNSVKSIGKGAFYECSSLMSVTIPKSVTSIGGYAFDYCTSLKRVTIPNSVNSISSYAFCNCVSLMSVTIPKSVTSIGKYAFGYDFNEAYVGQNFYELIQGFTIHGIAGSKAATYAKNNTINFWSCTGISSAKLGYTATTYSGKVKKPSVKILDSKGKTVNKKYYTVTYASGRKNVGTYKVSIKFKGKYKGSVSLYFIINPKGTSIEALEDYSDEDIPIIGIEWKKQSVQVSGYQIECSEDSNFKWFDELAVSDKNATWTLFDETMENIKYYVRIRTYKTVNGVTYYSGWSKSKTIIPKLDVMDF